MPLPDNFSSILFCERWGRDQPEPRDLTRDEQADIAALRAAIAIAEAAAITLRQIERRPDTDHTPSDTAEHLGWEVARLNESIREIERRPEREAQQFEMEGF